MVKILNVAIYVEANFLPAWEYLMVEKILNCAHAHVCLVIEQNATPANKIEKSSVSNALYLKIERLLMRHRINASEKKDTTKLFGPIPRIALSDSNIDDIAAYHPDIIVRTGKKALPKELFQIPRYGVWTVFFADTAHRHHIHALESHSGKNTIISGLKVTCRKTGNDIIIHRSFSNTQLFITRTADTAFWKSASYAERAIKELQAAGWEQFIAGKKKKFAHKKPVNGIAKKTSRTRRIKFFVSRLYRIFQDQFVRRFSNEQWILLLNPHSNGKMLASPESFIKIHPPKEKLWADPFLLSKNGKNYIFFEEVDFKEHRGIISVMEVDAAGNVSAPKTVLERPYFLSYPFIFEWDDEIYMIPETSENKTIELYRCTQLPDKWEFVMNLMENVEAVDTTIIFKDEKFWLFTNIKENKGASTLDELFMFYSDDLLCNRWIPHRGNPIISDVRKARPAGRLFYNDGKLYRPSQDCARRYGYAININEVLTLNENEYEEKLISKILPEWNKDFIATHTFSSGNGITVMDAMRRIRK